MKIKPILKPSAILTGLALLTIIIWRTALAAPDGRLHVILLDVGQGDTILIQTPTGRNVLIDGGPSLSLLSQGLGRRLSPGNHAIDWLVVANPGEAQISAVPRLMDRFQIGNILWAGPTHGTRPARELQAAINTQ